MDLQIGKPRHDERCGTETEVRDEVTGVDGRESYFIGVQSPDAHDDAGNQTNSRYEMLARAAEMIGIGLPCAMIRVHRVPK